MAGWAEGCGSLLSLLRRRDRGPFHHLLRLGRSHQPQRRADSASEGGVRDELRPDDAHPVHLLQHLPRDVDPGGTRRGAPRLQAEHGRGAHGRRGRRARLLSGGDRAVVSAVPAGPLRARERHHAAAGLGQPVYQPHRGAARGLEPPHPRAGRELARPHAVAVADRSPDPVGRGALRGGARAAAAAAAGSLPHRAGAIGAAAVSGHRRGTAGAGEPRVPLAPAAAHRGHRARSILSLGALAMWSVIAVGFFNSIMFPTLFTLSIEGLGPMTARASSLLVMAIFGGAVIPQLQGFLADGIGVQRAFVLPALCYAYIAWYALSGREGSRLERA